MKVDLSQIKPRPIKSKFEMGLIKKLINNSVVKTVNLREFYLKLKNGDKFSDWIKDRIEKYDFIENKDYVLVSVNSEIKKSGRGGDRRSIDYFGTLSMAKELAMVENNEMGKAARRYFIQCEELLKVEQDKINKVYNPFNLEDLGNDMLQVDVSQRRNQKITRTRLVFVLARNLCCGRHWIRRLTNEIYQILLDNPNATARNFRQHMNLPAISALFLTRDQLEGHIQIFVSGIEQSMLILWSANQEISFKELREFALDQAKLCHRQLLRIVQRQPSELVFHHEYNVVPMQPYRERRMQCV